MSDDLTNLRAAAEAAGMRLPLTMSTTGYPLEVVNGDVEIGWLTNEPAARYFIAAANAAPGLVAEVERLTKRRDELLATVARISQETPFPDEVRGWESQRRAMIAEVGTLRAEVARLRTDLAHLTEQAGPDSCAGMAERHAEELARLTQERGELLAQANAANSIVAADYNEMKTLRAEVARLTQERDGLRGLLREACGLVDIGRTLQPKDLLRLDTIRREGGLTDE